MKRRSPAQIRQLRELPLPEVATALGYQRSPRDPAKWKKASSIISINGSKFYDHLMQCGGGGAIDLVMHDHMCTFQQALQWLQPLAAVMPIPQANWSTVQHYLCQHRKLHPNLIEQYHRQQLIEADSRNNAVFCMRNAHQQAIGAELVGTHPQYPFKGLTKGTRKPLGSFWISTDPTRNPAQCDSVLLVESAIDALSVACLPIAPQQQLIVSTAGLAHRVPEWLHRLNLNTIVCGYDADPPAQLAYQALQTDPRVSRLLPGNAKDWNDLLRNPSQQKTSTAG